MKHHLQCAEQQDSSSNVTKYCTCHAKWLSWVMSVTYETSFTMRGATGVIHQRHQVLRLPRKMTLMIDVRHIWNVIYNARSNRHHPPTSPNTAPATQNYTPKSKKNLPKTVEASFPMRGRFDHDPNMIRPWNCKTEPVRSQSLLFPPRQRILYWKLQPFALRLSTRTSPNTAPATKSDTARSPNTAPATKSDSHDWSSSHMKRHLRCAEQQDSPSNVTKYCACHAKWLSWVMSVRYETSFTMRWATGLILQRHQILLRCYFTELLLYWAVTLLNLTLLNCYFTELLLYWTVTLLSCYFTELLLDWTVTYWAVTLPSCYFTELLLYWTVTELFLSELVLDWAVTLLSFYFTELLLYWSLCIFKSP